MLFLVETRLHFCRITLPPYVFCIHFTSWVKSRPRIWGYLLYRVLCNNLWVTLVEDKIVVRKFLPSIYELQLYIVFLWRNVFKFWCQTETTQAKIKIMKKNYLLKQDVDSRPQKKLPSRANECVVLGTFSYMSHSSSAAIY